MYGPCKKYSLRQVKMTTTQKKICNWLNEQCPKLADLYKAAVVLLGENNFPARERLISHAVREIYNRLPAAVSGIEHKRVEYANEVEEISKIWKSYSSQILGSVDSSKDGRDIPMPLVVVQKFDELIAKHNSGETNKQKLERFFHALEPDNEQEKVTLVSILTHWHDESGWFVRLSHGGDSGNELNERFERFELGLLSIADFYYEGIEQIKEVIKEAEQRKPTDDDVARLKSLFVRPQYHIFMYENLTSGDWLKPLNESGEFAALGSSEDQIGRIPEVQAKYLTRVAGDRPEEVLNIFMGVKKLHWVVWYRFIDALLEMPTKIAVKGVPMVLSFLEGKNPKNSFFVIGSAVTLMEKFAESHTNEAFAIAKELFEVWVLPAKGKYSINEIEAKVDEFEYDQMLSKSYAKLLEVDAFRAVTLLIDILEGYVKELQGDEKDDKTKYWYYKVERLDQISRSDRDIVAALVDGICEAGKAVIEKQPTKVEELLGRLGSSDKRVFRRIEMYLLQGVPQGTNKKRISDIIRDEDLRKATGYKYEYHLLLKKKFKDIPEAVKEYKGWVEAKSLSDEDKQNISSWFLERENREATEDDYEEILNLDRARELYLLREAEDFKEQYEKYEAKSKRNEGEIAPKPLVSTGWSIDPSEGTPLKIEDMTTMKPEEVVAYIIDEKNWKDKKSTSFFHGIEEGLLGAFGKDVQARVELYIGLKPELLMELKPDFITRYFDSIWTALREKKDWTEDWEQILTLVKYVVEEKKDSGEYYSCFGVILRVLGGGLDGDIVKEHCRLVWDVVEVLTRYAHNPDAIGKDEREKDPHDESINCVQGNAFESAIRIALAVKNDNPTEYAEKLSESFIKVLEYLVAVKEPKINSVFGVWFLQLHWLEKEWVGTNITRIFDNTDKRMWGAVWGSYTTWGRVAKEAFGLLKDKGIYQQAIDRVGEEQYFQHRKDLDKGLSEHLMIAYFNKWIEYDDGLLQSFFSKASAKLRGRAARFMTTGFKHVKESEETTDEQKRECGERLRSYWENRLEEISKSPGENIEETQKLAIWVKDSLLGNKETLDLLHRTLELSGGRLGGRVNSVGFVEGICKASEGNEIKAIRCLKLAFNEPEMSIYSSIYHKHLDEFFARIIGLGDEYTDVVNIRKEAIGLVDRIGRLCMNMREAYAGLYRDLNAKIGEGETPGT